MIQLAPFPENSSSSVFGYRHSGRFVDRDQDFIRIFNKLKVFVIQQVEAISKVYNGSNYGQFFNGAFGSSRVVL